MKIIRPWGEVESLSEDIKYQCNLLKINPGESTFPHSHPRCTEVHTVIQGSVIAIRDEEEQIFSKEQSIYIERFQNHHFKCISEEPFISIEVKTGSSFESHVPIK
jgi:mannose-6-phosphate isomerase-like protein (cupin superfamily)